MRKSTFALAALTALAGAWIAAPAALAQKTNDMQSPARVAAMRRMALGRASCPTVTVAQIGPAQVELFDLYLNPAGTASRQELSTVRSAQFCSSDPTLARIQTARGQRLVARAALVTR
jgi:hypothetical protein